MNNTLKRATVSKGVYSLVRRRSEALGPRCSHHKTGIDTHDRVFDEGQQATVAAKIRSNCGSSNVGSKVARQIR